MRWRILRIVAVALLGLAASTAGIANEYPADWKTPHFQKAEGVRKWRFPADHGQHPSYRLEWWYYTGTLHTEQGREFGFQVTFFREGLRPHTPRARSPWRVQSLYLAHVAISDVQEGRLDQDSRIARDSLGLSGAATDGLHVWLRDWQVQANPKDPNGALLSVRARKFSLQLTLRAEKPPVLHGRHGLDQKGTEIGEASWYYSIPRLQTSGAISVGGKSFEVTGTAWMDHEFGTNQLGKSQVGWDWFALRLSDGYDLMLYRLRLKDGRADPASHGTLIDPHGHGTDVHLTQDTRMIPTRAWTSEVTGARYPVAWEIDLPAQGINLQIEPKFDAQELRTGRGQPFAYWEGAVNVRGTHAGHAVSGQGYLELTGYAGSLAEAFR